MARREIYLGTENVLVNLVNDRLDLVLSESSAFSQDEQTAETHHHIGAEGVRPVLNGHVLVEDDLLDFSSGLRDGLRKGEWLGWCHEIIIVCLPRRDGPESPFHEPRDP